ncbi:hypothetical protein BJX64DRAFT_262012 [Aspergillus heterothallicus]
MSGLEIVGVVVGVIPIIVAAVEKYRERQSRLSFRSKDPMLRRLLLSLDSQYWLLQADVRLTLNRAGVTYDHDSEELSPVIFKDANISSAVDQYLGNDRAVYYSAIDRCHMALAELIQGIEGLHSMPKTMTELVKTYPTNGGQYELPKKIRFPIKRDELDRHIQEMQTAVSTLQSISRSITSLKEHAVEQPLSRQAAAFASVLNSVRTQAGWLYSAISRAYPIHCHAQHEARLFLQSRCDAKKKEGGGANNRQMTFTVGFSPAVAASYPISGYKGNITVVEEEDDNSAPTRAKQGAGKNVAIRLPTPNKSARPTPRSTLADICGSIRQARQGGLILDLYLSQTKCLTFCTIQDSSPATPSAHLSHSLDDFVPLHDLLQGKVGQPWVPIPKIALSLVVTSSLLQLATTPWLRFPLTSNSVWFSKAAVEAASLNPKVIPEPFVAERFAAPATMALPCQTCSVREYMLELGILLLEIQHWKSVDQYRDESFSGGQRSPGTRYDLARSWVDADVTQVQMLDFHSKVIERCIEFTFASSDPTPNWDDAVLRKSIAEYVIRPLQEQCPAGYR